MTRYGRNFLILAVLCAVAATNATAQPTIAVVYSDGRTEEDVPVWRIERDSEELYMRAHDVARLFRATQFWNATNRKVVLGIENKRFTLTVDTRVVVIDGEPVMLRNSVRYDAGFVMIPMEFVVEVAAPYTPNLIEWDRLGGILRVESVGFNVTAISLSSGKDRSTASIGLTEPLLHHLDHGTPGLVRLKLYGGRIDATAFDVREAHGLFNGVRAEQTDRDAYVYFDINRTVSRVLVEREDNPPVMRLVLERGELPEIPDPDFSGQKQVEIVDPRARERQGFTIDTVVLDPGHGGKDNGKSGRNGVLEKDVNLRIADATRRLIERELGVEVILTREDDRLLSLTRRTEIANESGGDIFVSIHCNSWFSTETGGFEVYFLSPAQTDMDRAVALAENASVEDDGGASMTSDIDFILWDMVQNEYIAESSVFAELIQKAMNDRLEIRNRGVKQANFVVLQGARMPAVLIEAAFLSNPEEEVLLTDSAFQERVAMGIVDAIRKFKERYE